MDLKTEIEDVEKQIESIKKCIDELDGEIYVLSEKLETLKKEQEKEEYKKYIGKAFIITKEQCALLDLFGNSCGYILCKLYIYIRSNDCYEYIDEINRNPILRLRKGHYWFSEDEEEIPIEEYMKKRQEAINYLKLL